MVQTIEKGYKQTEIGVIPEDWEVKRLSDILVIGSGSDYKHLGKGNIPVYGTGGVMTFVDDFIFDGNAVGIGRKGTINKPVFLENKFWTVDTLFYTHSFTNSIAKFIYYKFLLINWLNYNEASGVPSLSKNTIYDIRISLPPLPEQHAIGQVLTDTDQLLQNLKKLIAKKKAIKQGSMQELLTGKKRLVGFEGEWEVKRLEEIVHQVSSGSSDTKNENGKYLLYGSTGVIGSKLYYDYSGDRILIARVGANAGSLYKVQGNYCISDNTLMISCKDTLVIEFCYYYLKIKNLNKLTFGSGQPLITGAQIKRIEIAVPLLNEQQAIAQILSDMDLEIEALEKQLHKTEQLKQGLMQELLTGKTRLVAMESNVTEGIKGESEGFSMAAESGVKYN